MRIAILGWGSLIWQPEGKYGTRLATAAGSRWSATGPLLPIEFARISSDGRLTLVIIPGYEYPSRASWILSEHTNIEAAAGNLADREGIRKPVNRRNSIHGITRTREKHGRVDAGVADIVHAWLLKDEHQLDAAVWTGLGPGARWSDYGYATFSVENALDYLSRLEGTKREAATEYIAKAPPEIDTPVRQRYRPLSNPP